MNWHENLRLMIALISIAGSVAFVFQKMESDKTELRAEFSAALAGVRAELSEARTDAVQARERLRQDLDARVTNVAVTHVRLLTETTGALERRLYNRLERQGEFLLNVTLGRVAAEPWTPVEAPKRAPTPSDGPNP